MVVSLSVTLGLLSWAWLIGFTSMQLSVSPASYLGFLALLSAFVPSVPASPHFALQGIYAGLATGTRTRLWFLGGAALVSWCTSLIVGCAAAGDLFFLASLLVLACSSIVSLRIHTTALRKRARLEIRSRRWCQKNAHRLSHKPPPRGLCWVPLFAHVPWYVIVATGPLLNPKSFAGLARLYGSSENFRAVTRHGVVRENHLYARHQVKNLPANAPFFEKGWRSIGIELQPIVDTSIAVNAAQLGAPKAGEMFANAFKNAIQVDVALSKAQRARVEALCPHPILFTGKKSAITDHPELKAFREIQRVAFARLYQIQNTTRKTLCVGAGRFENLYLGNKNIDYYYHMSEGKDYERVTAWMLEDIGRYLNNKKRQHSKLRLKKGAAALQMQVEGLEGVISLLKRSGELPQNFLTSLDGSQKYETLVLHDSSYNLGVQEWTDLFEKTDAKVAYCTSILPYELIYPDMPKNQLYNYAYDPLTGKATLTYGVGGYSNGYCHDRDKWALPLDRPVINCGKFSLVFEIDSRAGPMCSFKVLRVDSPTLEPIVRSQNLPKNLRYCRVMDPFESCKQDGSVQPKYFSVNLDEFWETISYGLSLDAKSLSYANLMAFVRRRGGGISLVNKELLAPWSLQQGRYSPFCMAAFLYIRREQQRVEDISKFTAFDKEHSFSSVVSQYVSYHSPLSYIQRLLDTKFADELVLFPTDEIVQKEYVKVFANPSIPVHRLSVGEDADPAAMCDVCSSFIPKRGKQVIKCEPGKSKVVMSMTTAQLNKMRMEFSDTDGDAEGIKKVKEAARPHLPLVGFDHEVDFSYILGGPGCGKSYCIRAIAKRTDGVALPFSKLVPDYLDLTDEDGTRYNLDAKTNHRAIRDLRGVDSIFIDEFTALPWEYIQLIVYLSGAKKVFIVGDTKQTKVQKSEGMYIGDYVDIDSLPRHTLMRNFRNPQDVVNLLNRVFGYVMQAMSSVTHSINVYGPGERPDDYGEQFAFSRATCQELNLIDDNTGKMRTVRTYQGSTVSGHPLTLHVRDSDESLLQSDELTIVALSRHTTRLNIVHNGSAAALAWLDNLGLPHSMNEIESGSQPKVLPTTTPGHEQESSPLPVDDEELGRIFTDHVPTGNSAERRKLRITTTMVLSAIGMLLKFWSGSTFVNQRLTPLFVLFKFMYLNRVFFLHRENWVDYVAKLPVAFARATVIQASVTAILLPLRVVFPVLGSILQRRRGKAQPVPLNVELLGAVLDRFGVPLPVVAVWNSLSLLSFKAESLVHTLLPEAWIDLLAWLRPDYFGQEYFCDLLEPWAVQLAMFTWFGLRHRAQEDILFSVSLPSISDADRFHDLINGAALPESFDRFQSWFMQYIPVAMRKWTKVGHLKESVLAIPALVSPKDAYLTFGSMMPAWSSIAHGLEYPNMLAAAVIPNPFRVGTINPADFFRPTNNRGNPRAPPAPKYTFGNVAGHKFTSFQPMQVIQVLSGRYFNKKPQSGSLIKKDKAKAVLEDIVRTTKLELLGEIRGWDEDTLDILLDEFLKTASAKNYAKQLQGDDSPEGRNIRFHLKSIFKPAISNQKPMKVDKVGQGISAWGKDAQIMFGLPAKWINFVLLQSLKPNVIYDNRITPTQLRDHLRDHWETVPAGAKNGVTDFEMYDSQQDEFSQEIEKEILKLLGVDQSFLDHYFSFRKGGKLLASGISGRLGTEKTSGEPMTLLGNSVISMVLANWILRGDGPFVMAVKGDDGFKRQGNMRLDQVRIGQLSEVCRLKIKAYVEDTAEFCGFAIGPNSFCPSVPRKLAKVLGHEFRDYAHFCEYRKSMIDWLNDVNRQDVADIIATNSDLFGMSVSEVEGQIEIITSISHLNEAQWLSSMMLVGDPEVLQGEGGTTARF